MQKSVATAHCSVYREHSVYIFQKSNWKVFPKMNLCSWAYEHRFIGLQTYVDQSMNICSFIGVLFLLYGMLVQ